MIVDLNGRVFGRLTVIKENGRSNAGKCMWLCMCKCGNTVTTLSASLLSGRTASCGCLHNEKLSKIATTHGNTANRIISPEYRSWASMISRCTSVGNSAYHNYGGRGITVCERWRNSFGLFLNDMGKRPSPKHSLDRFPNNETGGYEPGNCRWATRKQQSSNQRTNRWLEYNGRKMILADWVRELNVPLRKIQYYLSKGFDFNKVYRIIKSKKIKNKS